jgi:hypothetical protein
MFATAMKDIGRGSDPSRPRENTFTKTTGIDSTKSVENSILALVADGVDRSGALGLPWEVAKRALEVGLDSNIIPNKIPGAAQRAEPTTAVISQLGPTFSNIVSLLKAGRTLEQAMLQDKTLTEDQKRTLRNLLPGQNMLGMKPWEILSSTWNDGKYWQNVQKQMEKFAP